MRQYRQHHTSLWGNTGNTILTCGATRATQATPYLCMGQRRQHHTYGATQATPYLHMGQHGQRHTYIWGNTGNTILTDGAMRATPYVWGNAGNTIIFMHGAVRTCTIISLCSNTGTAMHTCYVWGNTIPYGIMWVTPLGIHPHAHS